MSSTVLVFLKAPRPGHVKTRLARSVGEVEAAGIYRRLAEAQWRRLPAAWRKEVHFDPPDAEGEMRAWLGPGVFRPQVAGDLGTRLVAGFASAFETGTSPIIAIGGDCPGLDGDCLEEARAALREADVVLGPAADGGYYLIGLNRPAPELFREVPWSSERVLAVTRERAAAAGLRCRLLAPKADIDDAESWELHQAASTLTVVIPTLNESARVAAVVRSTQARLPGARVIVVDGGSSDGTAMLAKGAGAEVVPASRGRGGQLATGARLARSPWLLFLHADTLLPGNAAQIIGNFVRRPATRIATFRLQFDQAGWFLRACCWFTRFDSVFTRFGDQGILIRRDFYTELGGFPPWPLFEDVALLQRARRVARVVSLPAAVTTSTRRFENRGHIAQQWLNARLLFRYLAGTPPERLAEIYRPVAARRDDAAAATASATEAAEPPGR